MENILRESAPRTKNWGWLKSTIVTAILIIAAGYFLLPVIWMLIASTKNTASLFSTGLFSFPKVIELFHNISLVSTYQGGIYWQWYLNSVIYALCVAILTCLVCSSAAFALAKYNFKGRKFTFSLILASMIIPGTVTAIPLFIVENPLGLVNTYLGVILPALVNPFGVYFLRIYIEDVVPDALIEAARVDGASDLKIYLQMVLPVIRPALTTLFLISFIGMWNNFFLPLLLLHTNNLIPITVGIQSLISSIGTGTDPTTVDLYPIIITGSLLSILPMIIGFAFLKRFIVMGITQGSVKS